MLFFNVSSIELTHRDIVSFVRHVLDEPAPTRPGSRSSSPKACWPMTRPKCWASFRDCVSSELGFDRRFWNRLLQLALSRALSADGDQDRPELRFRLAHSAVNV